MLRPLLLAVAIVLSTLGTHAERKEIHFLSCNDVHANIDAMAQFGAVADSLRSLYPGLLVLSAGDNRTGNPLNDMYEISGYPMVALMNQIGFNATALGNHEFDSHPEGLARLIGLSSFRYLCANIQPADSLGIHCLPYQVFDVEGTSVAILGVVQLGTHGLPDTHPDNCRGITFSPVSETIGKYAWLQEKYDVVVLLSHIGYDDDREMAAAHPWLDLIIGGHSHTQLNGTEKVKGILITQNGNKMARATHTTLTVEDGKVTGKRTEYINVKKRASKNVAVDALVRMFSDNPAFQRVLTNATTPFSTYDELGYLMCDALREESGSNVGLENSGGVRYDQKDAGPFTVDDVLRLDPFGNETVVMDITGEELRGLIISCFKNDEKRLPYVSGITYEVSYTAPDKQHIKKLTLFGPDGKKVKSKQRFRVATSSYVASVADSPRADQGHSINLKTSDLIISYLEKQPSVSYQGVQRIVEK